MFDMPVSQVLLNLTTLLVICYAHAYTRTGDGRYIQRRYATRRDTRSNTIPNKDNTFRNSSTYMMVRVFSSCHCRKSSCVVRLSLLLLFLLHLQEASLVLASSSVPITNKELRKQQEQDYIDHFMELHGPQRHVAEMEKEDVNAAEVSSSTRSPPL